MAYRELGARKLVSRDRLRNFACRYFEKNPVLYAFADLISEASENVNHESKLLKTLSNGTVSRLVIVIEVSSRER